MSEAQDRLAHARQSSLHQGPTSPKTSFTVLHSQWLFDAAWHEWRKCSRSAKNDPDARTDAAIVVVLLAASATEAFINELAYEIRTSRRGVAKPLPVLISLANCIKECEDYR